MPDGQVVILSQENPYHKAAVAAGASDDQPAFNAEQDAENSAVGEFVMHALQLERMARVVRLLAMFDMLFCLMHALGSMWPSAIAAGMSYCGFIGARMFRRDLTRIYLSFLIVYASARVLLSAQFMLVPMSIETPSSLPVYLSATALVQLVIAHFVWRFYSLLPASPSDARLVQYVAEMHNRSVLAAELGHRASAV